MASQEEHASEDDSVRTWTDASGRFKNQGAVVDLTEGQVNLCRDDGRMVAIPFEKLSPIDRKLVEELRQAENPFSLK